MNTMVRQMINDYTAGSEVDHSAVVAFQEDITQSLTRATLQGAIVADEDYIGGVYYVVVYLSKMDVVNEINQAQAAAKLRVPALMTFNAIDRMDAAFARESARDPEVVSFE